MCLLLVIRWCSRGWAWVAMLALSRGLRCERAGRTRCWSHTFNAQEKKGSMHKKKRGSMHTLDTHSACHPCCTLYLMPAQWTNACVGVVVPPHAPTTHAENDPSHSPPLQDVLPLGPYMQAGARAVRALRTVCIVPAVTTGPSAVVALGRSSPC